MIKIALITDENYFYYALTTIKSIFDHSSEKCEIYCITTDVEIEKIERAKEVFKSYKLTFLHYDLNCLGNIKPKEHVSLAAYLKILLPDILKDEEKIIFLDSDLLIKDDISNLWNLFDKSYSIQAVWNPGYNYDNEIIGLDKSSRTFNSGVMLMNLRKMREENSKERLLKFIDEKNHLTKLNDQAAFNAVFALNWGELPLQWNVQYKFFLEKYESYKIEKREQQILIFNPSILHFTSISKPWMLRNAHPYKKDFKNTYRSVNGRLIYKDYSFISLAKHIKEFLKLKIIMKACS